MKATRIRNTEIVQMLIDKKAKVSATDKVRMLCLRHCVNDLKAAGFFGDEMCLLLCSSNIQL